MVGEGCFRQANKAKKFLTNKRNIRTKLNINRTTTALYFYKINFDKLEFVFLTVVQRNKCRSKQQLQKSPSTYEGLQLNKT